MAAEVLLVVNARRETPVVGSAPRKDYDVLQHSLAADVLDHASVDGSGAGRLLRRCVGIPLAQAWLAFKASGRYRAVVTDGEQVGIPLALLLKLMRRRVVHVTIGHRITASKKRPFFRWLRVQTHIHRIALHSRNQYDLAVQQLGIPAARLALVPYQVDTDFWRTPENTAEERLICSAGLEFRDYPTLARAVDGLEVRVVIGAASHWSKRRNTAQDSPVTRNVEVSRFDYRQLRDVYSRAMIVVVPLNDTDFQAGVTTILEAMSMGKAVIVTHSVGQTDVVEDRRSTTRGSQPRHRPQSFLRGYATQADVQLEPTGFYVPPNDPAALRRAINYLLEHPDERRRLGEAGRRTVEQLTRVEQFAERMRILVDEARAQSRADNIARHSDGPLESASVSV
jgi:glycosyltransferase involved in cell wall biosynthesis